MLTALDGAATLTAQVEDKPDVVVLDLGLPDLDGTDVIAGIRVWTAIPITVLSAHAGSGDKVEALDAGADDYVTMQDVWGAGYGRRATTCGCTWLSCGASWSGNPPIPVTW